MGYLALLNPKLKLPRELNVLKVYLMELKINFGQLHCVPEKNTHFCFDYNSGISWSINDDFYTFCTNRNRNEYSTDMLTKFTTSF